MSDAGRTSRIWQEEATWEMGIPVDGVAIPEFVRPPAKTAPRTTVIIAAYNEEAGLPVVLRKLYATIDESYEVIVIDDGSSDSTAEVAAKFPCRLISHEVNRGKGAAVQAGIRAASGEYVIVIDADDTYPAEEVPRVARELTEADIVVASRGNGRNYIPAFNRLGNSLLRGSIRYLYGSKLLDPLTGLYGARKSHLLSMRLHSSDFGIESEIAIKAARMDLKTVEFPIEYGERIGQAKLHGLRDGYRIFRTIVNLLALYNPTVTFILPGGLLFGIGVLLLGLLMSRPLSIGGVSLGVNSLMVASMLCLGGFQLSVFGFTLNVYALAQKYTKPDLVTKMFLRNDTARNISLIGLIVFATALGLASWLVYEWIASDLGAFTRTKPLILSSFLGIFGLQLIFSSVFLSIFTGELRINEGRDVAAQDATSEPGDAP